MAGFEVAGVDVAFQPDYCGSSFYQFDAILFMYEFARWIKENFDFVHASFPCQAHCTLTKGTNYGRQYADLIEAGRERLNKIGLPWVMENVAGSTLRKDLMLCGEMFGLDVIRHRFFEFSHPTLADVMTIPHLAHRGRVAGYRHGAWYDGPYVAVYGDGGGKGSISKWREAMGIDWTWERKSIAEAVPPAYTEWIGSRLL
jgi:hypothetical protein